jgi:hypothetical protein
MIRCSSLPLLFACPQSQVDGDSLDGALPGMDHDNQAGREGTATHEMIRAHFRGDLTGDSAKNICAFHGVEPAACWPLVNRAKAMVAELGLGTPFEMEAELDNGELTGHPDAEWIAGGAYWIGDWKSSRLDCNYYHQLMGYAKLRLEKIRAMPNGCELFVAWLRDGTAERYHVTAEEIEAWSEKMVEKSEARDSGPYVTGSHCTYCDRRTDCPAQRDDMRQALAVIGDGESLDVSKLDGPTKARIHRKLKMLANIKATWEQAIKVDIREHGPIDCKDGFHLALVEENGKREINTLKAWSIMADALTDDELAPCLTVGVTSLLDAVAKKAPPRKGAEAKRQLWAALEEAGAVSHCTVEKLKELRNQNVPNTKEIEDK